MAMLLSQANYVEEHFGLRQQKPPIPADLHTIETTMTMSSTIDNNACSVEEYLLPLVLTDLGYSSTMIGTSISVETWNEIRGMILRSVPGNTNVYTRAGTFDYPLVVHRTDEDNVFYPEFQDFDANGKREVITIV